MPRPSPWAGAHAPATALAPMQDVTTPAFMRLLSRYGAPDFFVTAYLRVHASSGIEPDIAECLERGVGRPVAVQLLGEDVVHLARVARALESRGAKFLDFNLGCPAPKVFRKNVGGGLLRDLKKIAEILRALRECFGGFLSVKTRTGFADETRFDDLLGVFENAHIDMLSVHGRTVRALYRGNVRYDLIAHAAARLQGMPVFANGDLNTAEKTLSVCQIAKCAGALVGRTALRNPWIFAQIAAVREGRKPPAPTLGDVRAYVDDLWAGQTNPAAPDAARLGRLKKFLNFVGQSVDADGAFLRAMRGAATAQVLFAVCDAFMGGDRAALPYSQTPYSGLVARPNCEDAP